MYHPQEGSQPDLPLPSNPTRSPALVCHGHYLYTIGGSANGNSSTQVQKFSFISKKWLLCSPLITARARPSCFVQGDYIYAVGELGSAGAERYNINTNRWEHAKNIDSSKWQFGMTALDGHIYCVGEYRRSIAKYDLNSHLSVYMPVLSISPECPMTEIVSLASVDGLLYALCVEHTNFSKLIEHLFSYDPAKYQ